MTAALLMLALILVTAIVWSSPPRPRGYQPRDTGEAKGAPPPGASAGHNSGRRA